MSPKRTPPGGWGPALVAVAACVACWLAGGHGTDWAAQVYRAGQSARYGLSAWDPGWYGGTFPLDYSVLYPLAAGWVGNWATAGASAAVAAFCWDRLLFTHFGRRIWASWYFAVSTVVAVAIGQLPTLAGEALALACVLVLAGPSERSPRPWAIATAGVLAVASALTSPVAGSFLALSLGAWALARYLARSPRRSWAVPAMLAVLAVGATAALPALFPSPGYFPFLGSDLVVIVGMCALLAGPWLLTSPVIKVAAGVYGLASVALFLTRNQLGDNDARFAAYIGVPLALCYLARPHGPARLRHVNYALGALVALGLVAWEWSPARQAFSPSARSAASLASFYQPLLTELRHLSGDRPTRVEVPPTLDHWESAYIAPMFALARGWERQLDMAYDPIFYRPGALNARTYRSWLVDNGVTYVALANTALDYAATAEGALLRSGHVPGLRPVWADDHWRLWQVQGSPGLASGPAQVQAVSPEGARVVFSRAGASVLKFRWSGHWSLAGPATASDCLRPAANGWTYLSSSQEGEVKLSFSVGDGQHGRCGRLHSLRSG